VAVLLPPSQEAFAQSDDAMHMIMKMIEDMQVHTKPNGEHSIEFCPDNTCDFILARRKVQPDSLKDFAFIYMYFFSDYYVLEEWRRNEEPAKRARQILSKPSYKSCARGTDEEAARCLLRWLSRGNQISLYFVRYDEEERNVASVNPIDATVTSRLKR
jgi:hypothetical protein